MIFLSRTCCDHVARYGSLIQLVYVVLTDKERLQQQYQQLNPAALKREISRLQKQVFTLATSKPKLLKQVRHNAKPLRMRPMPLL
jgi:hypothetical protein